MPSEECETTVQAGLNLHWAYMSYGTFSDAVTHI